MKLLILDFRQRLDGLLNGDPRIRSESQQEYTKAQLLDLAAAESEPFVILWHITAKSAIDLMCHISPHWPPNLCGCVFFSSEPYANAGDALDHVRQRIPAQQSKRIHLLSAGIGYDFTPNTDLNDQEVWERLCRFRDKVLARSGSAPVDFGLLEPIPAEPDATKAKLKSRIEYLAASDRRVLRQGLLKVPIDCPTCPKRGFLHHELEKLGDDPLREDLQDLLTGPHVNDLRALLGSSKTSKREIVDNLCRIINVRMPHSPEWMRIAKRVDAMFETCSILNHDRAERAAVALDSCDAAVTKPSHGEAARELAVELRQSLDCGECQKWHKVLL